MSRRPGLLTPLLLVSIAGCAGVSPATVRQDLLAGRSPGRDIEGVPFIPPLDHYCGLASLAGDLFAWGAVTLAVAAVLAALAAVGLGRWPATRCPLPGDGPRPASARWGRRGLLLSALVGAAALVAGALAALRSAPAGGRGYREVARWPIPGGEGRFIAVGPEPTPEELRALGGRLREEFRQMADVVVMVFDDADAAREVRRGSRVIGEVRFQAALAHQRAMYLKQSGRKEESLTLYERYPGRPQQVVRY